MDLKAAIEDQKKLMVLTKKINEYVTGLIDKKRELVDKIEDITSKQIEPIKTEISQIDAEVESYFRETKTDKMSTETYTLWVTQDMEIKTTDLKKAIAFVAKYPQVAKKDIFKTAEIEALIEKGIVPDPNVDGIDANGTYANLHWRKK